MKESDYPALHQSASTESQSAQKRFYVALFVEVSLLSAAALISAFNSQRVEVALLQAVILAFALFCSVYLIAMRPERYWYSGRAVAESIKTVTWRFVTRAEPFDQDDLEARSKLTRKIKSIIEQNAQIAKVLTSHLDGVQITEQMIAIRSSSLDERKKTYLDFRIVDQQTWYAKKAKFNRVRINLYSGLLILCTFVAIGFALSKPFIDSKAFWPTDFFVTVAGGLLSWIQAKRYQELSASYALTAHEISLIREQFAHVMNERDFSKFIGDAENAFSREHTQWVARRDE